MWFTLMKVLKERIEQFKTMKLTYTTSDSIRLCGNNRKVEVFKEEKSQHVQCPLYPLSQTQLHLGTVECSSIGQTSTENSILK